MRMRFAAMCIMMIGIAAGLASTARATELNQEEGIFENQSADYVRTLNRYASTDADAAFYNPAGLAFMKKKGLHLDISNQTMYIKRTHSMKYWGISSDLSAFGFGVVTKLTSSFTNPLFYGNPKEYNAELVAPVLPGVNIVYNGEKYAVYFNIAVTQAAPDMKFNQGLAIMDWGTLATMETLFCMTGEIPYAYARKSFAQRTEYYVSGTIGGAYKFIEQLSAALGIRYIYATGNQKLKYASSPFTTNAGTYPNGDSPWLVDTDLKGHGLGLILGLHAKPIDRIDIGVKAEYYLPMVLVKDTNKFQSPGGITLSGQMNIFLDSWWKLPWWETDPLSGTPGSLATGLARGTMNADTYKKVGNKLKATYPPTLSAGFSIKILKNLRAETSGMMSFRPFVDLDGREKNWNIGYRVGQCLEWYFVPTAAVSVGYVYNDFGIKKTGKFELNARKRNEADPLLTSHTLGTGFKIIVTEWLDLTLGGMYMIFTKEKTDTMEYTNVIAPTLHGIQKKFDENRWSIAIGLTAHVCGDKEGNKTEEGGATQL
jgi:opacity protein-like surface antigen